MSGAVLGQIKTVDSGLLVFADPEGRTREQAKQWVVEQAKVRAMANEFGTRVKSETVQVTAESNGQMDDSFTELNVLQVKGEWVETKEIEGPTPEIRDGEIWWAVRVRGKARPLKVSHVELEMDLRSDILGSENVAYLEDGDRLRARFLSPVDGHVMFFYAEDEVVYALSNGHSDFAEAIQGQKAYSLFSSESEWVESGAENEGLDKLSRYAWKFKVTNPQMKESQGMLYGAFATHGFAPPKMDWQASEEMWTMDAEQFDRWFKQNVARSDQFQMERLPIRIRPKQRY